MNQHKHIHIFFCRKAFLPPVIGVILLIVLMTVALSGSALAAADAGDDVIPDWEHQGEIFPSGFGYSVDNIGDVDNDGYDDVIVGSYLMNRTTESNLPEEDQMVGKLYVFGSSTTGLQETPAYELTGENKEDWLGYSVSDAGDLNDDDIADFIASAPLAESSDAVTDTEGRVYVFLGQNGSSPLQLAPLVGEAMYDRFGISVSGAGDVNHDGYDDIIVGAHFYDKTGVDQNAGKAYVYYGADSGIVPTATWTFVGENASDKLGEAVAGAGDVNGDGYADVMVGAPKNDDAGDDVGKVYLFYGSDSGLPTTPSLMVTGAAANDEFGAALEAAGDVNGDGYDDIVIGAYHSEDVGEKAGKAYIYYGSATGILQPGVLIDTAERAGDEYGFAVDGVGDVNGDGFDDIIIGAHRYDIDSTSPNNDDGKAYLYGGCVGGLMVEPIVTFSGSNTRFGISVSGAGDVNKDGYDDILVGEYSIFGKVYEYHSTDVGACTVSLEFTATVAAVGQGEPCGAHTELGVPSGTEVTICYRATNKGSLPISWNELTDNTYSTVIHHDDTAWQPDETRTYLVTSTITSDIFANSTWNGGTPITTPNGAQTIPADKELSLTSSSTVTVTVSSEIDEPDSVFLPLLNKD